MPSKDSALKLYASLPSETQSNLLRETARKSSLSEDELAALLFRDWRITGRQAQQPPVEPWHYWLILAGRGWGKSLTGSQWAKREGLKQRIRFAFIAPTLGDVRDTMLEGETGILSVLRPDQMLGGSRDAAYNRSLLELTLANGTHIKGFSSEKPDRLRGPQHHRVWMEEVSSFQDAGRGDKLGTTFSNAKIGCRLGDDAPKVLFTTTPKPNRLTTDLLAIPGLALVTGSSYENRDNLSEGYWQEVVAPLEGTRTGLQEIHAQVIDEVEGALWTRALLDDLRVDPGSEPPMKRLIVAVDPQGSTDEAANEAGIIVVGVGHDQDGYVVADRTPTTRGPTAWGQAAVDAYHDYKAEMIVAETNYGAAMVEFVIKTIDPSVGFKEVSASRGKRVRAEPIATVYEKGRVHHVGAFPELETEMVTWTPDPGAASPNRMDALVWGLTELGIWQPPARGSVTVPRGRIRGIPRYGPRSATTNPWG